MRNVIAIAVFVVLVLPFGVSAKEGGALPERMRGGLQVHGTGAPDPTENATPGNSGFAKILKAARLPNYPSITFGSAIDKYRYFARQEWKETSSSKGKTYVDFTGWLKSSAFDASLLKNGISARGIGIKFLVNSDGTYAVVMVSRFDLKTDGYTNSNPISGVSDVLNKIYSNVEIKF